MCAFENSYDRETNNMEGGISKWMMPYIMHRRMLQSLFLTPSLVCFFVLFKVGSALASNFTSRQFLVCILGGGVPSCLNPDLDWIHTPSIHTVHPRRTDRRTDRQTKFVARDIWAGPRNINSSLIYYRKSKSFDRMESCSCVISGCGVVQIVSVLRCRCSAVQ